MSDSLFGSDSEESDQEVASEDCPAEGGSDSTDQGITGSKGCQHDGTGSTDVPISLVATSLPPPAVPGLYYFPDALPSSLQDDLAQQLSKTIWTANSNQVMLFDSPSHSSLPPSLIPTLSLLESILEPLPLELKSKIFDETNPRQCILNLYRPGQGISPHVDLPNRYDDGIVGISLLSSTVMEFYPVEEEDGDEGSVGSEERKPFAIRLKPGSIYVLSGEARYRYKHGIAYRREDLVEDEEGNVVRTWRGMRMSVTLRRMIEGADVVGPT